MQRPDLSGVDPQVVAYIEYLEKKAGLRAPSGAHTQAREAEAPLPERSEPLPPERETTYSLITVTHEGKAKRTYRHLYTRQHRGGMGVFGIDLTGDDEPLILAGSEENANLLFFTSRARVFRLPAIAIKEEAVNARGEAINERFSLDENETLCAILPEQAHGYVALVSEGGRVRVLRHHLFGANMKPGTAMFNYTDIGPLASVCWTEGNGDLLLLTRQGMGIRFAEKTLSPQGDWGIKLSGDDKVAAITPVYDDSSVFMVSADGRGTLRLMSGFAANKSPGGSGKLAIKSSRLVGAVTVEPNDDLFLLSKLGKIVRFPAGEVPSTEGVVQGVNCMGLRGDEVVKIMKSGPIY